MTGVRAMKHARLLALLLLISVPGRLEGRGCNASIPVWHFSQSSAGGFVISELAGRAAGPTLRFWTYGGYAKANSGSQGQFPHNPTEFPWLIGGSQIANSAGDVFYLFQANWMG